MAEALTAGTMEALAQAIHGEYCEKYPGMPNTLPWERLEEGIRESNRGQARQIPAYLALVGCRIGGTGGRAECAAPAAPVTAFTPAEIEIMARQVHRVWTQGKAAGGWVYGPVRDDARKIHPLLHIRWDDLAEAERDKDRNIARGIIPLLAAAGLAVYRSGQ